MYGSPGWRERHLSDLWCNYEEDTMSASTDDTGPEDGPEEETADFVANPDDFGGDEDEGGAEE